MRQQRNTVSIARTRDGFLSGRIQAYQPRDGFRAGHDTVLLAASVPAGGGRVLELGSGAGIASLCLAVRVTDCDVLGVEIDPELVAMASENAQANGLEKRVRFVVGDATVFDGSPPFDHVFFNPPFHAPGGEISPNAQRDRAMRDPGGALCLWTRNALRLVRDGGTVSFIVRADRLDDAMAVCPTTGVTIVPLLPHAGEAAKRAIVQIAKGSQRPLRRTPGLVLHEAGGTPTGKVDAILRHGAGLGV